MSTFQCKKCNYVTYDKSNFLKHKSTKKHIKKVQEDTKSTSNLPKVCIERAYTCQFCGNEYASSSTLSRHKKACSEKINLNNNHDLVVKDLQKEIEHLKELHMKDKEMKQQLEKEVANLKTLLTNAGVVVKKSVSALAYVAQNYKDAPQLDKLNDYSYLQFRDEDDEFDLLEMVFTHYRTDTLHKYLGDIIVNAYKKNNPDEQALWNSDTVRLTYVIRDLINQKTDWTIDKKGVKTTKYIIEPLLEYLRTLLAQFIDDNCLENYIHEPDVRFIKRTEDLQTTIKIIAEIKNKILAPKIIKYIAPHFYLPKNDELIEV